MNSEEGGNGASPSVVPSPESSEQTAASQFRLVEGTQVVTLDSMSEDDAGQEADALSGSEATEKVQTKNVDISQDEENRR